MRNLLLVMTAIFIVGCASSPKDKKEKELSAITQNDFKEEKQILYNSKNDILKNIKSEFSAISNEESLQRVYQYDGKVKVEDNLTRIANYCYQREFKKAYILVRETSKRYSKNPVFWNQLGTCYLLENKRRKALLFFNKALSLKRDYAPALNNLGVMYTKENDFSRALVAFNRAKKSKEFSRTPRFNLAKLYLNFGLYKSAIQELTVLYRITKKDVDVTNMLATAYLMQNDAKKARSLFLSIDREFTDKPSVGINYALAEYFVGNKEKAKDIFEDIEIKKLGEWKTYYLSTAKILGLKVKV